MNKLSFLIALIIFSFSSFAENINIIDAGAKPDGESLCTEFIQSSIDKIAKTGGGTVIVPPGTFLTGSILLKSGVTLDVQQGAVLLGSTNLDDYLSIQPKFVALRTGQPTKQLIFAEGQTDIAITGSGTINGQGAGFSSKMNGDDPGITRPHLIQLINCKNVKIENVNMLNSGGWMQHYLACENLQINGITVYNHCNKNNDGIDIDGCKNVIISNCIVDSDDDGICLKSTSPTPCIDVVVTGCIVKSHCNALKMGTETTGGFQNISFTNCVVSPSIDPDPIYGTLRGQSAISVEMVDGGLLEGVNFNNITVTETDCPIFIRLGNRARKHAPSAPEPEIGILRNVNISNVIATSSSKTTSNITGIPDAYAENITLNNIMITNLSSGSEEEAKMEVHEKDGAYPTAAMFNEVLPASGFFVRHVRNITFNNIQLFIKGENVRPAFIFHDVEDALVNYPVVYSYKENIGTIVKDRSCENVKLVQ